MVAKAKNVRNSYSEEIPYIFKIKASYRANQDQIRNQGPRLRRHTLFLGRKAGGGGGL